MNRRDILKGFGIAGLFSTLAQFLFTKTKPKELNLFEPGTLVVTVTELDTGEVTYRDSLTQAFGHHG